MRIYNAVMSTAIQPKHVVFAYDCPDAAALGTFYATLLGWQIRQDPAEIEWVEVVPPEGDSLGFSLAFQQVENYRPPTWPEGPVAQQAHLDFHVESIAEASALAESAGAVKHPHQHEWDNSFVVCLDPAGCLVADARPSA